MAAPAPIQAPSTNASVMPGPQQRAGEAVGRVALISGGSGGIGTACVSKLQSAGWRVSVVALPGCELDRLAAEGVVTTAGDLTRADTRAAAVKTTLKAFGQIDVLINTAGVGLYARATDTALDHFRRLFEVNVFAPLALAQLVITTMRGGQRPGIIVNVGSVAGSVALPWAAGYSASKSALHAVHDALRRELRGTAIHLIKVCPGIVATDFRKNVLAGVAPPSVCDIRTIVPAKRVAEAIVRAIERRSTCVYIPRIAALFELAGTLMPSLMDRYLSRYGTGESN